MPVFAKVERKFGPPRKLIIPAEATVSIAPASDNSGNPADTRTLKLGAPDLGHLLTHLRDTDTLLRVRSLRGHAITRENLHPASMPDAVVVWQEKPPLFAFFRRKLTG